MMLLSEQTCTQGEEVSVRFALPIEGKIAVCKARVQWVRVRAERAHAPQAIGLEFVGASSELRASLGRYVGLMTGELQEPVEPMPISRPAESGQMPVAKPTMADTPIAIAHAKRAVGG